MFEPNVQEDRDSLKENTPPENDINHEAENNQLRKQIRLKEAELKKTKAILEQRVDQLQSQLTESQERESNLKHINNSIMQSISDLDSKTDNPIVNKAVKELEVATEQHHKEMQEYKQRSGDQIRTFEIENRRLKDQNQENELLIRELKHQLEKNEIAYHKLSSDLENEKNNHSSSNVRLEEDKKQYKELLDYEMQLRLNELKAKNEKLKEEHRKEIEILNKQYDTSLQELKTVYEDEKVHLQERIEKTETFLKQYQDESETGALLNEVETKYQKQIKDLNNMISELKKNNTQEVSDLKKQKEELFEKNEKLEASLKKMRVALRNSQSIQEQNNKLLKQKLDKAKTVMEQGENMVEENKKNKQKIIELKSQIKKLEVSEQKLKGLIMDKEEKIDEERLEFKKMMLNQQQQSLTEPSQINTSKMLTRSTVGPQSNASKAQEEDDDDVSNSFLTRSVIHGVNDLKNSQIQTSKSKSPLKQTISNKYDLSKQQHTPSKSIGHEGYLKSANKSTEKRHATRSVSNSLLDPQNISVSNRPSGGGGGSAAVVPLETSFADQDMSYTQNSLIERKSTKKVNSRLSSLITNDSDRPEKLPAQQSSQFEKRQSKKNIDIDSIPLNYDDYVKKTERSRRTEENSVITDRNAILDDDGLIVTTTNEEDQEYGTSHFFFENEKSPQIAQDIDYDIKSQFEKKMMLAETKKATTMNHEIVQPSSSSNDDYYDHPEKECNYSNEPNFISKINKRASTKNISSASTNHQSSKLITISKDDFAQKPSLMNPIESMNEMDLTDSNNFEPQYSVDYVATKSKTTRRSGVYNSSVAKNEDRERKLSQYSSTSTTKHGGTSDERKHNDSRQKIEDRLKHLEHKLQQMELKNQGLKVEKDKVQVEFEKLMLELKQAKNDTSMLEDNKKEEKETALKNEIKFLINKLLKVKNKLEKSGDELNTTKVHQSVMMNQSQINMSITGSSSNQNMRASTSNSSGNNFYSNSIQLREKGSMNSNTNNNNNHMNSSYMSVANRNDYSNYGFDDEICQLRETPSKTTTSLGQAIQKFAMNVRSKSNMRYNHNRASQQQESNSSSMVFMNNSTNNLKSYRARTPHMDREDSIQESMSNLIGREVLQNSIQQFGGYGHNNNNRRNY